MAAMPDLSRHAKDDEFVNWPDEAHIHDCRPHAGMSLTDLMDEMAATRDEPLRHPPEPLGQH